MGVAYPPDLARYVVEHWPAGCGLRVPQAVLEEALATAFHASMTSEEARPTRFRLLLSPPEDLPEDGVPNRGVLRLTFERSRPFQPDELRRLAPAAAFETALIGVHGDPGALRIWGIAHSGPAWLAPSWGGRDLVPNWSYDPIIHVTGPGQLAVRCAGKLVAALERGNLGDATMDVFESDWLPKIFARERAELLAIHAARQAKVTSPTELEDSLVGRIGQHMLKRAIRLIRGAHHGGMLLIVDPSVGLANSSLRVKYRIGQDEPARRYRSLILRISEKIAAETSKTSVGWTDFAEDQSKELAELEQTVFEWSRVISNLAGIDGAVVLDRRFGLLGFGAEVSAELPSPPTIWRALDANGDQVRPDDVESVGTRHRAAYRFANDHPSGLAIVMSHDGGVSFVANRDGQVVVWEQSLSP